MKHILEKVLTAWCFKQFQKIIIHLDQHGTNFDLVDCRLGIDFFLFLLHPLRATL